MLIKKPAVITDEEASALEEEPDDDQDEPGIGYLLHSNQQLFVVLQCFSFRMCFHTFLYNSDYKL